MRRALQKQVETLIHRVVLGSLWEEGRKEKLPSVFSDAGQEGNGGFCIPGGAQDAWTLGSDQLVNENSFLQTLLLISSKFPS